MSEIKHGLIADVMSRRFQAAWDPTLNDSIQPVVVLENEPPEYKFYEQSLIFQAGLSIAEGPPSTTNWKWITLANPGGSQVLVVLSMMWGQSGLDDLANEFRTALPQIFRHVASAGSLNLIGGVRDTRWDTFGAPGNRRSVGQIRSSTADPVGSPPGLQLGFARGRYDQRATPAAGNIDQRTGWDVPIEYVISPGEAIGLRLGGVNGASIIQSLDVTFTWRERVMSSWEKQLLGLA